MSNIELQMDNKLLLEVEQLKVFVARLIAKDPKSQLTFEEVIVLFKQYQVRMDRLREELRPAYEACQRGESEPWDMKQILEEAKAELRNRGIH